MFKPKSCLTSYGGELGSYIGIQGDMGRKGTSWWVKPDESGHRAGWTGSGTGPSGSKPDSGPDVTGRGFGSPGIASGWHRSTFRSKSGRAGQEAGQTGPGTGRSGQEPGQTGPVTGRSSSSRFFFLFLPPSSSFFHT